MEGNQYQICMPLFSCLLGPNQYPSLSKALVLSCTEPHPLPRILSDDEPELLVGRRISVMFSKDRYVGLVKR